MEAKMEEAGEAEAAQPTAEYEAWFKRKVQEGLEAARAGEVVTAEAARQKLKTLGIGEAEVEEAMAWARR